MKCKITLMVCSILQICSAQKTDSLSINVIQKILAPTKSKDTIVYTKTLSKGFSPYFKNKFKNKNAIFFNSYVENGDTLLLKNDENTYILEQLDSVYGHKWEDGLFLNSSTISSDSLWEYLEISKSKQKEVLIFSKPIFIRNNSICLIYTMHFKGLGGPVFFGFYKNTNGIWKEWISIASGDLN